MKNSNNGDFKTTNYLVSSYGDLTDVIQTVETMVREGSDDFDPEAMRQSLRIAAIPLPNGSGSFILRVRLPECLLQNIKLPKDKAKPVPATADKTKEKAAL